MTENNKEDILNIQENIMKELIRAVAAETGLYVRHLPLGLLIGFGSLGNVNI